MSWTRRRLICYIPQRPPIPLSTLELPNTIITSRSVLALKAAQVSRLDSGLYAARSDSGRLKIRACNFDHALQFRAAQAARVGSESAASAWCSASVRARISGYATAVLLRLKFVELF